MNKDISNMLMSHFFGEDWEQAFADPIRKAEIDEKIKKALEMNRLQREAQEEEE